MLVLTHNTWCTGSAYPVTNRRRCALLVAEVLAATPGHDFVIIGLQECFAFRAGIVLYPVFAICWVLERACPYRLRWFAGAIVYALVCVPWFAVSLVAAATGDRLCVRVEFGL